MKRQMRKANSLADRKIRKISWEQVEQCVDKIASELVKTDCNTTELVFVGVERGGVIPAMLLAQKCNGKFRSINVKSKDWKEVILREKMFGDNVMFVDDIADTGHTLYDIDRCIQSSVNVAINCVTLYKRSTIKIFHPDHIGQVLDGDDWLQFPWEIEE